MNRIPGLARAAFALVLALTACRNARETPEEKERRPVSGRIRDYPLPSPHAVPRRLVTGPDESIWFTEENASRIGRISAGSQHDVTEFLLEPQSRPFGIVVGEDGNLWFTESGRGRIGRILANPPHSVTEFPIPGVDSRPTELVAARDGRLWFLDRGSGRLGRLSPRLPGVIDGFDVPGRQATALAAGPDGAIWFVDGERTLGRLDALDPKSTQEFELADRGRLIGRLWPGEDSVWFLRTEPAGGSVGWISVTPPHSVTELSLISPGMQPTTLLPGQGVVWLANLAARSIDRLSVPSMAVLERTILPQGVSPPDQMVLAADGGIWFPQTNRSALGCLIAEPASASNSLLAPIRRGIRPSLRTYVPRAPAPRDGQLDIRTEMDCVVSIDGIERFRLGGGDMKGFAFAPGRHVVSARAEETGRTFRQEVEVFPRLVTPVLIEGLSRRDEALDAYVPTDPHIAYVEIPAGAFQMGSEAGARDERPQHLVRLTRGFEMSRYEVTQQQWSDVMGPVASDSSKPEWQITIGRTRVAYRDFGLDKPIVNVSFQDIGRFLERLDALEPAFRHRLPTEAEWEYACRAGSTSDVVPDLGMKGWYKTETSWGELHPVGKKLPNAWGLYDIHGNVNELCQDWYEKDYYLRSSTDDPPGPASGNSKVFRGGDAWNPAGGCRCANRGGSGTSPANRSSGIGFRPVRARR